MNNINNNTMNHLFAVATGVVWFSNVIENELRTNNLNSKMIYLIKCIFILATLF